jgi:hypothetical protein
VAYRGQLVYALDIDEFRVFDGDAWQIPTAASSGGLQMFVQGSPPVADNVGDFWLKDTTYQIYVWDGSIWQEVQDPTADAAASAASAAQVTANDALGIANDAQATADGKVTTFYQGTEPAPGTEDPQEGDIWFRTSDNRAFIYHSGAFVEIQDQGIVDALDQAGTAQATADQKISSYFQAGPPWPNGTAGHGNDIGDLWYDTDDNNKPYRWDGNWTPVQDGTIAIAQTAANTAQAAADAAQGTADDALAAATSDGAAPASSPNPESLAGIGIFVLRWTPILNNDPVTYEVHVSSTLGFTADSSTKVGETTASQFVVKSLPGSPPAPGDPDPRILDYDTTYYARLIAKDADGAATQSSQAVCSVFRVTGVDLQADSVTAANIVAGTLTGELFAANVILAGTFKTAETGQRVEVGIAGVQGYKSDGSLMINFPTDPLQTALIDAEIVARALTVTNGGVLRQTVTLDTGATLNLKRVVTSPQTSPQMSQSYAMIHPVTTGLTAAQKTGNLGTFDLIPADVSFLMYTPGSPAYWTVYQIRPTGTRYWFFDTSGAPYSRAGIGYFVDVLDWEIWSAVEITASTSAKNGTYTMARYIPDGALMTYYLRGPMGRNRYSRQNGANPPVIGTNGPDVFIAEIYNDDELHIRYYTPNGDGGNISAPFTVYESTQGFIDNAPLSTVLYSGTGFDMGAGSGRYLTGYRGYNYNNQVVVTSGTNANSIFPSGSGNNWASANKDAHSFETPTLPRCVSWDGSNFWTYGADGYMYQHSTNFWDPAVTSSTVWAEHTFYDSNATGGTHESTPGPIKSFTWKRRSSIAFTHPALPAGGGTDDPNQVRTYMGRGSSTPANAAMWLQYASSGSMATVSTITLAGTNPPTVNNFPTATAGKITNDAATLNISGDGSIAGTTGSFSGAVTGASGAFSGAVSGTTGTYTGAITTNGNTVATEGPYYYAYLSSVSNVASGSFGLMSGYTTLGSSGITLSAGNFTLPRTGRYRLYAQTYWGIQPSPVGKRIVQWVRGATILASGTTAPSALTEVVVSTQVSLVATAGDVVFAQFFHTAGGTSAPVATNRDITFITIDWIGT